VSSLPPDVARVVDQCFAAFPDDGAPGIAYGVVIDGTLVHSGGRGTAIVGEERTPDADTAFRIASMTKSFVAAAILLLRDRGALALDDPITSHVPEATGIVAGGDAPAVTLRHLLTMSAGLPSDDPWADRNESISDEELTAIIGSPTTFAWTPGTAYDYSNLGFALLGRTITNVTGRSFRDVIREELIDVVGLPTTRWRLGDLPAGNVAHGYWRVDDRWEEQGWQEPGAFSAIGGLYSSVRDIARWVAGFCDAWPARSDAATLHPLSRATRREQQALATAVPPQLERDHRGRLVVVAGGYCMGLVSGEDIASGRTVGHSGGYPGFGTHMRWHPATGIGVVSLANGRYAPAWKPAAAALRHLVELLGTRRHAYPPTPAFLAAQGAVGQVLHGTIALDELDLAPCVALDESLEHRQAAIAALTATHGQLGQPGVPMMLTPVCGSWLTPGETGTVLAYAKLTPEDPPRIQELDLASIPAPPPSLQAAAEAIVAAANAGGAASAGVAADGGTLAEIAAIALELHVLLAPCTLEGPADGDGATAATFTIAGRGASVELALTMDAATGAITTARVEPVDRPATPR
jgi:CubicO group peptidase (beta-lactamase class C family)